MSLIFSWYLVSPRLLVHLCTIENCASCSNREPFAIVTHDDPEAGSRDSASTCRGELREPGVVRARLTTRVFPDTNLRLCRRLYDGCGVAGDEPYEHFNRSSATNAPCPSTVRATWLRNQCYKYYSKYSVPTAKLRERSRTYPGHKDLRRIGGGSFESQHRIALYVSTEGGKNN